MEKAYKCSLCSQEFNSRSKLNAHTSIHPELIQHAQKKQFKCNVCGYKVCSGSYLVSHMRKHTGERPFKCTIDHCGMTFKVMPNLKNHMRYKHSDERRFKCKFPGCPHTTKTISNLIGHEKVHSDDRPFACPNTGCSFRARERSTIKSHVTSVHSEAKQFACTRCGHKMARKSQLKAHMLRRHSTRRDFKCSHPQCTEAFKTSYDLKLDFSNRHGERNIQCDHSGCDRKYANAIALRKHKWDVHSKEIHSCPNLDCDYRTNKMRKLASHMIVHDKINKKFPCSIKGCEYRGKNRRGLESHLRRHEILLPCSVSRCDRYLSSQKALNNHVKLHNPVGRPFQCPLCFQHYSSRDELKCHTRFHTKEKPFKCGHCEFGASGRAGVKTHICRTHANHNFPVIVHPSDDQECLRCKLILPAAEFLVHSVSHAILVVMITRVETRLL